MQTVVSGTGRRNGGGENQSPQSVSSSASSSGGLGTLSNRRRASFGSSSMMRRSGSGPGLSFLSLVDFLVLVVIAASILGAPAGDRTRKTGKADAVQGRCVCQFHHGGKNRGRGGGSCKTLYPPRLCFGPPGMAPKPSSLLLSFLIIIEIFKEFIQLFVAC